MNTIPEWITVYPHQRKSSMFGPWMLLLAAFIVSSLALYAGITAFNRSLQQPELQYNNDEVVVRFFDTKGIEHTPINDPLFTQRVNQILKSERYDKTFSGPDKK